MARGGPGKAVHDLEPNIFPSRYLLSIGPSGSGLFRALFAAGRATRAYYVN